MRRLQRPAILEAGIPHLRYVFRFEVRLNRLTDISNAVAFTVERQRNYVQLEVVVISPVNRERFPWDVNFKPIRALRATGLRAGPSESQG